MWVNNMGIGRIAHCAAACIPSRRAAFAATVALFAALGAQAGTTYWLDNSVAASGDGTSRATAFKTWNEAWAALVATASGTTEHVLNVVASETPYTVTSAPSDLAGSRRVATIRGVDGDGNDVVDPASVVVDGQGLYQIAPCNTAVDMRISGITFRNATSASAGTMSAIGAGAAIDLKEYGSNTQTGGNVVSNCVFEGCTGGTALVVTGSSNTIVRCIFRSNTSAFASSLDIRMGSRRTTLPSYVQNCTFEGNDGSAATSEQGGGNAVFALGLLEMSDCTFRANKGSMNGSAMYLYNGAARAISDCSFLCNTNTYSGSEVYGGVVVSDYGNGDGPVFRSCTFSGNVCEDGYGCLRRGSSGTHPVSLYGCTFSDNRAKYGAAIALASGNKTLLASNCVFRTNSATSGGVIYRGGNSNVAGYRVDLVDCEFSGNGGNSIFIHSDTKQQTVSYTNSLSRCRFVSNLTASHVINVPYGILLAEDCTFTNNVMADGTVLRCGVKNPGVGTTNHIANCLFAKNTNSGESSTAPTALSLTCGIAESCTIADNKTSSTASGKKGSVFGSGYPTTTFLNCIFSGNDNDSSKWNNYTAARNCFVDFSNKNLDASNIGKSASADPGFADAANGDYTLNKTSICRNAGANQPWMVDATDIVGKARINEDVVDLGCYEFFMSNSGMMIFVR